MNAYKVVRNDDCLQHHGILGQKWGVRRFQNEDGSLTNEGRVRYGEQRGYEAEKMYRRGSIDYDKYVVRTKPDTTLGKIDDAMHLGKGRQIREFVQRHKKGIAVAATLLGAGLTPVVAPQRMVIYATAGALAAMGGLAINDVMVNKAYNGR